MAEFTKLAWRNLWRNWRRTVIALVAIVLGVALLLFFDGLLQGSDQAIFGNAVRLYGGNVQVHAPGYLDKASRQPLLPLEDADAVVQAVPLAQRQLDAPSVPQVLASEEHDPPQSTPVSSPSLMPLLQRARHLPLSVPEP